MDDDDLAALLRSQTTSAPLPSWSNSDPSPTLDPFANPFADGPSRSTGPAYGSTSLYAGGQGRSFGNLDDLPSAAERRETTEVHNRIEEVYIAQTAGDGVQDVSPYVARLQNDNLDLYGNSSASMQREGSGRTITGLEGQDRFDTAAGFDLDTPYVPPPISRQQSSPTAAVGNTGFDNSPPLAFDRNEPYSSLPPQPLPTSLYRTPSSPPSTSFNANPLSTPFYQYQPAPTQQAPTSPPKQTVRVFPSSLLTPDILGPTPEDSLKKAFVKSSSSSAPSPVVTEATKSPQKDRSAVGKQPYVFKPGGNPKAKKSASANVSRSGILRDKEQTVIGNKELNEVKEANNEKDMKVGDDIAAKEVPDEETEKTNRTRIEDEGEDVKNEVPTKSVAETAAANCVDKPDGIATDTAEDKKEAKEELAKATVDAAKNKPAEKQLTDSVPATLASSLPVGPKVAEQMLTDLHPANKAMEVAESSQLGVQSNVENGLVKDLSQLPALPSSEQSTPRAGTPAGSMSELVQDQPDHAPTSTSMDVQLPTSPPQIPQHTPHSASTISSRSPHKYDKVSISPLDQPQHADTYERGFSSLSLGGNAGFENSGFSSADPSSAFASSSQTSWGKTYDEPENGTTSGVPGGVQAGVAAASAIWNGGQASGRNEERVTVDWGGDAHSPPTNGVVMQHSSNSHQRTMSTTSSRSSGSSTRHKPPPHQMFTITLSDPTKVGDPIRGHVVYTITTRTTSPHYRRSEFSVLRRFSEFLWLFEAVSNNNPGVIVPPVPDKHPFGRFEDQFIETRRSALERCLGKMANHPVLGLDPDLRLFLESDTFAIDLKHRRSEMTQDKQSLLAGFGGTLIGSKYQEQDEWFNQKKVFLDSLESQLKSLIKSVETTSKQRLDLAMSISELGDATMALSECDLSHDLTEVLSQLANLIGREKDQQETQAKMDVVHLLNTGDEYMRTIGSVRLAFASRIKSYHTWQAVEAEAKKMKVHHEKLRKQGKIAHDRIGPALAEIAEAERRGLDAHSDFDAVSRLVKIEFARFDVERMEDFKDMLERYLDGMVMRQKELILAWEKFHSVCARLVQQHQ